MRAFTLRPDSIVASALTANALGSVIGTIVFLFVFTPEGEYPSTALAFFKFWLGVSFYAFLSGLFWVFIYVAPLLALLRRLGYAGPAVAMLLGILPALVGALIDPLKPFGVLSIYGPIVSLIFCLFSYRGVFSNKTLQSPASQAGTVGSDAASGP